MLCESSQRSLGRFDDLPGSRARQGRTCDDLIAGIGRKMADHTPYRGHVSIVDHEDAPDTQEFRGVEAVDERVIERVPAVDEDEVETFRTFREQSRKRDLGALLEQLPIA